MVNDEFSVRNILAKEGLGSFAFEFETLYPDLESVSLAKLLATVILESNRLPDWPHQNPESVSDARECHHQANEIIDDLTASEEPNYRRLLIIGYLYGRLTKPSRESVKEGDRALLKVMLADMKRSEGGKIEAANRKSAAAARKAKAKKVWDEFIAAGRQEREVAALVAKRMGVTAKTVRGWRRSGWR